MATGYADFPIHDSGVVPFIGLGIGWSQNNLDSLSWKPTASANITPATRVAPGGTADSVSWQLALGVSFLLTDSLAVDFSYRYFDGGDVKSAAGNILANGAAIGTYSGGHGALTADEITVSLRFLFGSL
jgi:opacity protein-like surface antigen